MKNLLIPVVLLMFTTVACKKKNEPSNPVGNTNFKTYASMDEVFTLLELKPKVLVFDASVGKSFYGNSGTRYTFAPSCFIDASGSVVTGNVQVEVTEYLKKGDMIFSGVLPISDGESLISGGEFNVRASKNGQELFIKPGLTFQANIPRLGSKDTTMSLFRGLSTNSKPEDKVNWRFRIPDTGISWLTFSNDSFHVISDSLRYWNADKFMNNPNYQKFTVYLVGTNVTIDGTSLYSYVLYDGVRALLKIYNGQTTIPVVHVPDIPCHFISYGLINGHFYGGVIGATPQNGEKYTITLTEVDPADFKAQLALYE